MIGVNANNFLVLQFVSGSHIWVVDVICTLSNYVMLQTLFFYTDHNFQIGGGGGSGRKTCMFGSCIW